MRFTWDPKKAKSNLQKHGVAFEEAASVLKSDGFFLLLQDLSGDEERFKAIGFSSKARCLVVIFCEQQGSEARIISARKAEKQEENQWHRRR